MKNLKNYIDNTDLNFDSEVNRDYYETRIKETIKEVIKDVLDGLLCFIEDREYSCFNGQLLQFANEVKLKIEQTINEFGVENGK